MEIKLTAITAHVDPTALVAEVVAASASHVIAARGFLHPESAFGALFEFLSDGELHEIFVFLVCFAVGRLVVLAGLPSVVLDSTVETVVLPTTVAGEV